MQSNENRQYRHPETKPFEPWLSRSLKQQGRIFPALVTFLLVFLAFLGMRAVWELHAAGQPITWLIIWAAFVAACVVFGAQARAALKKRSGDPKID